MSLGPASAARPHPLGKGIKTRGNACREERRRGLSSDDRSSSAPPARTTQPPAHPSPSDGNPLRTGSSRMASSCSSQTVEGALLLLGFHLFQAVLGTTVTPLCGRNETGNCTTVLIRTVHSPRVAEVKTTDCGSDLKNYCINGHCKYLVALSTPSCTCEDGYYGDRCGHSTLTSQQPLSNEYLALTILLVLFFVITAAVVIYYFYRWYQNKSRRLAASSNYKEVSTETEKDNKLLHV
ncbi:proepiregulin [Podarcis muralis]|uniref:Epiregulin n=2 Tax=Podarcis TaxID=42163 RepID=A0A670JFA2_PODMU|nr:proepiregulin [Podarcis muralis]